MDAIAVFWVVILVFLAILTFFSNLSVFIAVYKSKRLQNRGNIFLLSLACSDFLVSCFNIPFTAVSSLWPELRMTGSTLCNFSGFFEMTFLIASVFSVTAMNVHRYIHLVHWTTYYDILKRKRICLALISIWLAATILAAPPLFHLSKISFKTGKSHCFVDWKATPVYTFALMTICFFVPVCTMGFCYYRIYRFWKRSKSTLNVLSQGGQGSSSQDCDLSYTGSEVPFAPHLKVQHDEKFKANSNKAIKMKAEIQLDQIDISVGSEALEKSGSILKESTFVNQSENDCIGNDITKGNELATEKVNSVKKIEDIGVYNEALVISELNVNQKINVVTKEQENLTMNKREDGVVDFEAVVLSESSIKEREKSISIQGEPITVDMEEIILDQKEDIAIEKKAALESESRLITKANANNREDIALENKNVIALEPRVDQKEYINANQGNGSTINSQEFIVMDKRYILSENEFILEPESRIKKKSILYQKYDTVVIDELIASASSKNTEMVVIVSSEQRTKEEKQSNNGSESAIGTSIVPETGPAMYPGSTQNGTKDSAWGGSDKISKHNSRNEKTENPKSKSDTALEQEILTTSLSDIISRTQLDFLKAKFKRKKLEKRAKTCPVMKYSVLPTSKSPVLKRAMLKCSNEDVRNAATTINFCNTRNESSETSSERDSNESYVASASNIKITISEVHSGELHGQSHNDRSHDEKNHASKITVLKQNREDKKLTRMCVVIVAAFFISWFPFVVTMFIESLTSTEIPMFIDKMTLLIGYLNSLSNPLIYCYFNRTFRSQLKKQLLCNYGKEQRSQ